MNNPYSSMENVNITWTSLEWDMIQSDGSNPILLDLLYIDIHHNVDRDSQETEGCGPLIGAVIFLWLERKPEVPLPDPPLTIICAPVHLRWKLTSKSSHYHQLLQLSTWACPKLTLSSAWLQLRCTCVNIKPRVINTSVCTHQRNMRLSAPWKYTFYKGD